MTALPGFGVVVYGGYGSVELAVAVTVTAHDVADGTG